MSPEEKIKAMTRGARKPYSVSIVDDDRAVREALGNLLDSVGLNVAAFASAEDFVNSAHAKNDRCLILDVQLPRMSGLQLQRQLSAGPNSIPIIFITGYADAEVQEQALRDGAVGFFHKPFDSNALLDAVCSVLK
jgi:FixJ family two-component response regulator